MNGVAERHVHHLGPAEIVVRYCGGCNDPMRFKLLACTRCADFTLLIPAELPRPCRGRN